MVRKPVKPKRKPFKMAGKNTVKDKDGRAWQHVLTTDETEAKRIDLFYKRSKKDFRIERVGDKYEVFVRRG